MIFAGEGIDAVRPPVYRAAHIIPRDRMADSPIPGYITKAEAARRYQRDLRTIGKDISAALALRNEEFLAHLKLRTKDGIERNSLDVEISDVVALRDEGMVPTWYLKETYLDRIYKTESEQSESEDEEPARTSHQVPPIIDAEFTDRTEDETALSLLANPMIQMQSKRIADLEKDRERDAKTIASLTKALDLLEQHARQQARSESSQPSEPSPTVARKRRTPQSAPAQKRKSQSTQKKTPQKKTPQKKRAAKQTSRRTRPAQKKHWLKRPLGELFTRR